MNNSSENEKLDIPHLFDTSIATTPYHTLAPTYIEATYLDEPFKRYSLSMDPSITYTGPTGESRTVYYPATSSAISYKDYMKITGKEEETNVELNAENFKDKYVVCCKNTPDLLSEHILTTLSATKGKLMFEIAPIHIKEIQCKMTPAVRKNIVDASKRLRMYGKKSPIVPSFDEYGNRLSDHIEIGDDRGITVQIVDPEEYGVLYFELTAIKFPDTYYNPTWSSADWTLDDSVPF